MSRADGFSAVPKWNEEANYPDSFGLYTFWRCCRSLRHTARRQFQRMGPKTLANTWNISAEQPQLGPHATCDSKSCGFSNRTRRTPPRNHVVCVELEERCSGRNSTAVCTLVVQCWAFGNLTCFQSVIVRQTAGHTLCNAKHPLERSEPRTVIVSIVRDAALDDQLVVLSLCLWFEAFSDQFVLLRFPEVPPCSLLVKTHSSTFCSNTTLNSDPSSVTTTSIGEHGRSLAH